MAKWQRYWVACIFIGSSAPADASSFAPTVGEIQSADPAVTDGSAVTQCGWPTTVATSGCTATLIHAKAISTAQHCGQPSSIRFGESQFGGPGRTVSVTGCVGTGSQDAQICELAEEVTDLPVTPVLFGCEVDEYLQVGQPVVIAGFGQTSFGVGGGTKLWANQSIASVQTGRVIIGDPGDSASPCPGDSGGPVFLQVSDGSWRVFGTVLGGTTGTPCNSAADFQRIDQVVANFESQRGIDITPCFDGATGAWDPTAECGNFFAGDHEGVGAWDNWCAGTPAGGYSDECGTPFGGVDDPDAGPDDPDAPDSGPDDPGGDGDGGPGGNGGVDSGCGCRAGAPVSAPLALWVLAGLWLIRSRRRAC